MRGGRWRRDFRAQEGGPSGGGMEWEGVVELG